MTARQATIVARLCLLSEKNIENVTVKVLREELQSMVHDPVYTIDQYINDLRAIQIEMIAVVKEAHKHANAIHE
jgi:hypothetical protein